MQKYRIAFIGNFDVDYSTENHRKISFEELGHTVIPLQESRTYITTLYKMLENKEFDLLIYSHTHGWNIPNLREFFEACRSKNIPTISVHLDRWAWLERESDIGTEATWFTQFQFMADASPEAQDLYNNHHLNWKFLAPGVLKRECYLATPDREKYPHDIIFVGSRGYHHEYKFRPELIDFLKNRYKEQFGHYGGDGISGTIRGAELNTLYASAKIVIGDSCFGGRPYYWSDRVTETIGRGGFLLHPKCIGMGDLPIDSYDRFSLESLEETITYWLEHDTEREKRRIEAHLWVKNNATYTHRAKEIINTIFK